MQTHNPLLGRLGFWIVVCSLALALCVLVWIGLALSGLDGLRRWVGL